MVGLVSVVMAVVFLISQCSLDSFIVESKQEDLSPQVVSVRDCPLMGSSCLPTISAPFSPLGRALSLPAAKEYVLAVMAGLPVGFTFTSQWLFKDIVIRGDKRNRGSIIRFLRGQGLIVAHGFTQDDQAGRNNGFAVLWVVVKNEE